MRFPNHPVRPVHTPASSFRTLLSCTVFALAFFAFASAGWAQSALALACKIGPDTVLPGNYTHVTLTASNRGAATMTLQRPTCTVPSCAKINSVAPGNTFFFGSSTVSILPGETHVFTASMLIPQTDSQSGNPPPDGSILTLNIAASATVGASPASANTSASVTISSNPNLNLQLEASDDASVQAANTPVSFSLTYSNAGAATASATELQFPLPTGATFVSADGGGALGGDNVVRWNTGAVPAGGNGQRHVKLQLPGGLVAGDLFVANATFTHTAQASLTARARAVVPIKPNARVSMTVEAVESSVKAGENMRALVKVVNRSNALVTTLDVYYRVPSFTGDNLFLVTGTTGFETFLHLPPGESATVLISLPVLKDNISGLPGPTPGTLIPIDIVAEDNTNFTGAAAHAHVLVRPAGGLNLDLSTSDEGNTQTANAPLAFTLNYSNSGAATENANLFFRLPAGCTFVSAEAGGALNSDGLVAWSLGDLPAGAVGQRHVTVMTPATPPAKSHLVGEASITSTVEPTRRVEARASVPLRSNGFLTFTMVSGPTVVKPGGVANINCTVSNGGTTPLQVVRFEFITPEHTYYSNFYNPGKVLDGDSFSDNTLAPGESKNVQFSLPITNGDVNAGIAPPSAGTLIPLVARAWEQNTGITADARCLLVVQPQPRAALDLTADDDKGSTQPGASITFTADYGNILGSFPSGGELTMRLPAGCTFGSAGGGGALGADGLVHWTIPALGDGALGSASVTATVDANVRSGTQLLAEAFLTGSGGQASAEKSVSIRANPQLSITAETTPNPALPGNIVQVKCTITNHQSTAANNLYVSLRIPNNSTGEDSFGPGRVDDQYFLQSLAPGQTGVIVRQIKLDVTNATAGTTAPPAGSILPITVHLDNGVFGFQASASTNIRVRGAIAIGTDSILLRTTGTAILKVLANDSSIGGALRITGVTQPAEGTVTISGKNLVFKPNENFTGTANFSYTVSNGTASATGSVSVSQPFLFLGGMYNAQLIDEAGPIAAGFLTVKADAGGNVSGKIFNGGKAVASYKGLLDANRRYRLDVTPRNMPRVRLDLQVTRDGQAFSYVKGTVQLGTDDPLTIEPTSGKVTLPVEVPAATYNTYTFSNVAGDPRGIGKMILKPAVNGTIKITGTLGDGTPYLASTHIDASRGCTVHVPLSGGKGFLLGRLGFDAQLGSDVTGSLVWIKPGSAASFPSGIGTILTATGAIYTPRRAGEAILNYPGSNRTATVTYNDDGNNVTLGTITESATKDAFTIDGNNTAALKVTITRNAGLLSGSFTHPTTGRKVTFVGVAHHKAGTAAGVYKIGDHTGRVVITR